MDYQVINRPKLSRNKYGEVENKGTVGGANSLFSPTSSSYTEGGGGNSENIRDFIGSTATEDGIHGLVPAPKSNVNEIQGTLNDNVKFLKGNGTWVDIPISRYTSENHNKDGVDLNGNLTVNDTLTTQTLNVLGAAHFWELIIDKVKAAGGNLLITPANFVVDYVGGDVNYTVDETQSPFDVMFYDATEGTGVKGLEELFTNQSVSELIAKRLYMKNSDGVKDTVSEFMIGDMVRCKTLNMDEASGFTNKDYWSFVLATGTETYDDVSCIYIDIFYKYVANGTTYGLGTTITYQETPIDTHLTLHENEQISSITDEDQVVIITTAQSNMFYAYFNSTYHGNLSWDGTKWNFDETSNSISLGSSFLFSDGGEVCICQCVMDSRWEYPVIKFRNTQGHYIYNQLYAYGFFYTEDYIEGGSSTEPLLESFKFGYGTFTPETGDNIVSLGHLWNGERQSAILISSYDPMDTELKAPAIAQYSGIRTFTRLSPYRTSAIAANGNVLKGSFLVDYNGNYIDINERLNIFSTDLTTGLEKVGIHLDGENSTIKMVGSVEVRQNGDDDIDTLTVWDEDGKMRVKISPEQIPSDAVNPETTQYFSSISGRLYPSGTITEHHTWTEFIWSWNHKWEYYLTNGSLNLSQTLNLGDMTTQDKITVSDFSSSISTRALFKGTNYTSNRGSQSISSVIMRLQRYSNGNWTNVSSENITSSSTIDVSAEYATIKFNSAIFNNREITTAGNYRLKLDIVFNVYASITFDNQQSNPYYYFDTSVVSKVKVKKPTDSLTIIGRDGIVFHTENTDEYFKASESGIEMRWGDAGISLDNANGLKITSKVQTVSSSSIQIDSSASIVNATGITSATTIYLPDASTYGVGRELTIYGNDYVSVAVRYSGKILIPIETVESNNNYYPDASTYPYDEYSSYPLSPTNSNNNVPDGDGGTMTVYYRAHHPVLRLLNLGLNWLKI